VNQETTWLATFLNSDKEEGFWISTDIHRNAPFPSAPFADKFPNRGILYTLILLFSDYLLIFPKGQTTFMLLGASQANYQHLESAYQQLGLRAFRLLPAQTFIDCLTDPTFSDLIRHKKMGLLLTCYNKSKNYVVPFTPKTNMKNDSQVYTLDFHSLVASND